MAIVGLWVAIVGYGIAYAGMVKLGGGQCGIVAAFQGKCKPGTTTTAATTGTTNATRLLNQQSQQQGMIGTQPIVQVA